MISRLESIPLRTLWRHEAKDFSEWLGNNLGFIGDKVGIILTLVEREKAAGDFAVDILAEANDGSLVVIENQLEQTDHDHLGKLITYMSNLGAKIAIWITSDPRPEHERAVHWLNETLPADTAFYLLKIEAYRIDNSAPAPLLSIVAGPSLEGKNVGKVQKELAERHVRRLAFWEGLLKSAKQRTNLHARVSPTKDNWIGTGGGRSGLSYNYVILMGGGRVELYIDTGDAAENKRIFEQLVEQRERIEADYGGVLSWQRLEGRRACRISDEIKVGGLVDQERWTKVQTAMIDVMIRLHRSLDPHIRQLHRNSEAT